MLGSLLKKYSDTEVELLTEFEQVDTNRYATLNDFKFDDLEVEAPSVLLPNPLAEARRQRVLDILNANPSIIRAMIDDHESDPLNVILTLAVRYIGTVELLLPKKSYDGMAILNSLELMQTNH